MAKPIPPITYLNSLFLFDDENGVLIWKKRPRDHFKNAVGYGTWNAKHPGTRAGHIKRVSSGNLYVYVKIDDAHYYAHRIIFKMVYGKDPDLIDHIDLNGTNNKLCNLREATYGQNAANSPLSSNNKTGFKGVAFMGGKYVARCCVGGCQRRLGSFDTPEEASDAYFSELKKVHGEFARVDGKKFDADLLDLRKEYRPC
jgi:hypothetical protein